MNVFVKANEFNYSTLWFDLSGRPRFINGPHASL
jgi:hypothetical protein